MTRLEEIHLIDEVEAALDRGGRFDGVVQGVDLSPAADRLGDTDLGAATFIGCRMPPDLLEHAVACGALVMPPMPGLPYRTGRRCVYTVEELYEGFDPDVVGSYADTLDARVYRHWVDTGRVTGADVVETLARRLHDHGITVEGKPQLVVGRALRPARHKGRCGDTAIQRVTYIICFSGQEQLAAERIDVAPRTLATTEGGAADGEFIVLDRVEHSQAGIRTVA